MSDLLALLHQAELPLSVLMLVIFCLIAAWTYSPRRRQTMDDSARIPLRDDR